MSRKGQRASIERGISQDHTGYSVRVSVGTGPQQRFREARFPPTVDLPYLRAQRASMESDLRAQLQREDPAKASVQRGTLAGDALVYLAKVQPTLDKATYKSRASELKAWTDVLGAKARHTIRDTDIARAFAAWKQPQERPAIVKRGKTYKPRPWVAPSAKTIQNRCRTLAHLYRTLDGEKARTPLDDVTLPARVKRKPRATDLETIRTVVANLVEQERRGRLRDAKTRARFLVMVTTGQRPAQIARTRPEDVRLDLGVWYVPAAKGGEPIALPLNSDMRMAWTLFAAEGDAWGRWDSRSFARTLRTSGWPPTVKPYNVRHTVGIALSAEGVDLGDIQPFLGHSRLDTTREFYVPGLFARLKIASDKLDKRVDLDPTWARYMGTPLESRRNGRKRAEKAGSSLGS